MGERLKDKIKQYKDLTKYPLAFLLTVGALHSASFFSYAPVHGIQTQDMNGDGVKDELVIFPLKGTERGILGYIDGNDLSNVSCTRTLKTGYCWGRPVAWISREYTLSYFNFNPLTHKVQTLEDMYPQLHSIMVTPDKLQQE